MRHCRHAKNGASLRDQRSQHRERTRSADGRDGSGSGSNGEDNGTACAGRSTVDPIVRGPSRVRQPTPAARRLEPERMAHITLPRRACSDALGERRFSQSEFHRSIFAGSCDGDFDVETAYLGIEILIHELGKSAFRPALHHVRQQPLQSPGVSAKLVGAVSKTG
jgi:hypothetical protein